MEKLFLLSRQQHPIAIIFREGSALAASILEMPALSLYAFVLVSGVFALVLLGLELHCGSRRGGIFSVGEFLLFSLVHTFFGLVIRHQHCSIRGEDSRRRRIVMLDIICIVDTI